MAAPKTQPRLRAVTSRGEERRARKTLQGESSLGGPSPLGGLFKLLSPACGLVLSVLHTLVFVGVSGALDICPVFSTVSSSGPVIANKLPPLDDQQPADQIKPTEDDARHEYCVPPELYV